MERQVLNLTRPGEPVMDYKGETIYRPQAVLLHPRVHHAQRHRCADWSPIRCPRISCATGCHVAQADGPQWPDRARGFMDANFIDLGRLRASGQWLAPDGSFTHRHPRRVRDHLDADGQAAGLLDGTPYRGARQLAAGVHTFVGSRGPASGWPASGRRRCGAASRRSTCAISISDGPQPHARHRAASGR